jgi:hypothetical protein
VAARLLPGEGRGHLHLDGGSDIQDLHKMVASTAEPLDADRFVLWVRARLDLRISNAHFARGKRGGGSVV